MKKHLITITSILLLTSTYFAHADVTETGFFRIIDLGCSKTEIGGECFVTIDTTDNFGPQECRPGVEARWFVQKGNGRSIFALLMAAWAGNDLVSLAIEGNQCFIQPSSGDTWPTIGWIHVRHPEGAN